jgi:hypothetical protein
VLQWCSVSDIAQAEWWWFCRGSDHYSGILTCWFWIHEVFLCHALCIFLLTLFLLFSS